MSIFDTAAPLSRRGLLAKGSLLLGGVFLAPRFASGDEAKPDLAAALDRSRLVYISPLHPGGEESRCHGEVWYFVDGGDVIVGVDTERWKASALRKGWKQARIWVGDFGPISKAGTRYRSAPTFLAEASFDENPDTFARLMTAYGGKYASEWEKWGPRFEKSYKDRSRVLIRYRGSSAAD